MIGRSHLVTGATAGAWFAAAGSLAGVPDHLAVLAVGVVAYSALLPDLDHPRSTATYSLGPVTIALSWLLRWFVEHRGATHTLQGAFASGVLAGAGAAFLPGGLGGWVALLWGAAVTVGCLTHIWADARTVSGVPHPRGRGKLRIGRPFRTGSKRELWLLRRVYTPCAAASGAAALLVVALA